MKRDTGSVSASLPSSNSIMTATLVMGLVIDAMRKMLSGFMTDLLSTS